MVFSASANHTDNTAPPLPPQPPPLTTTTTPTTRVSQEFIDFLKKPLEIRIYISPFVLPSKGDHKPLLYYYTTILILLLLLLLVVQLPCVLSAKLLHSPSPLPLPPPPTTNTTTTTTTMYYHRPYHHSQSQGVGEIGFCPSHHQRYGGLTKGSAVTCGRREREGAAPGE